MAEKSQSVMHCSHRPLCFSTMISDTLDGASECESSLVNCPALGNWSWAVYREVSATLHDFASPSSARASSSIRERKDGTMAFTSSFGK
jgi:hypothetical protein